MSPPATAVALGGNWMLQKSSSCATSFSLTETEQTSAGVAMFRGLTARVEKVERRHRVKVAIVLAPFIAAEAEVKAMQLAKLSSDN